MSMYIVHMTYEGTWKSCFFLSCLRRKVTFFNHLWASSFNEAGQAKKGGGGDNWHQGAPESMGLVAADPPDHFFSD